MSTGWSVPGISMCGVSDCVRSPPEALRLQLFDRHDDALMGDHIDHRKGARQQSRVRKIHDVPSSRSAVISDLGRSSRAGRKMSATWNRTVSPSCIKGPPRWRRAKPAPVVILNARRCPMFGRVHRRRCVRLENGSELPANDPLGRAETVSEPPPRAVTMRLAPQAEAQHVAVPR